MKILLAIAALTVPAIAAAADSDAKPAAAPAGQKPPPMAPAKPAPEFVELAKYLDGSWSCQGDVPASPMGPEHKVKSTMAFKKSLDGFWLQSDFSTHKDKANPIEIKYQGFWGYDPTAKTYTRTNMGAQGDWLHLTSPGWEGSKMVWTGELHGFMGQTVPFRHTIEKKSDKEFVDDFAVQAQGNWMTLTQNDICKKK